MLPYQASKDCTRLDVLTYRSVVVSQPDPTPRPQAVSRFIVPPHSGHFFVDDGANVENSTCPQVVLMHTYFHIAITSSWALARDVWEPPECSSTSLATPRT